MEKLARGGGQQCRRAMSVMPSAAPTLVIQAGSNIPPATTPACNSPFDRLTAALNLSNRRKH